MTGMESVMRSSHTHDKMFTNRTHFSAKKSTYISQNLTKSTIKLHHKG